MGRVFSGVQPTGNLHLGNYLGAIRNWVAMQQQHECIYCIVDLHAITVPQDPEKLRASIRATAASYIACGIDPAKSIIFNQSTVSAHSELGWILSCHTPLGWLNRMTQFKEKAGKQRDNAVLGLYSYPVLMAADILGYKATHVPVGEDQKQHLELARDIAGAFNRAYGVELFPLPEPLILGEATRVMSLRDGRNKMSKSDPSDYSRIHLLDSDEEILQKIRKAKSDMLDGITYDVELRPEASNLLTIYASVTQQTVDQAVLECGALTFSAFKQLLADALIAHIAPIRATMTTLLDDQAYLDGILKQGAQKAQAIADPILDDVKDIVGFFRPSFA